MLKDKDGDSYAPSYQDDEVDWSVVDDFNNKATEDEEEEEEENEL